MWILYLRIVTTVETLAFESVSDDWRQVWSFHMFTVNFSLLFHLIPLLHRFESIVNWLALPPDGLRGLQAEQKQLDWSSGSLLHARNSVHHIVNGFVWVCLVVNGDLLIQTDDPVAALCILSDLGIHRAAGSLFTQNPPQRFGAFVKPSRLSDGGLQLVRLRLTQNPHPGRRLWWVHTQTSVLSEVVRTPLKRPFCCSFSII